MRIAIWHNLPSGGGKRALYDQVAALQQQGHELESWCPPSADQDFLPLGRLVREHVVPVPDTPKSKRSTLRELRRDVEASVEAMDQHCQKCADQMIAGGFDVLFASSCSKFRVTSIGRLTELPSVLYLQEPYRWLYEALPEPPWAADDRPEGWWYNPAAIVHALKRAVVVRRRQVLIREEARNARSYDLIGCNSYYSRESILRAYGVDAEVCYLGIDVTRLTPGQDAQVRRPFFLTVGAGMAEKNVDFIVRSLALRSDQSWPLVWVANTASEEHLAKVRSLAGETGITLEIRREVSHDELLDLYREATLFLYAPRLEPFGLAPLEASACGLPTVAVAEAGVRESVSDGCNGFLVAPDEGAFAAKIDEVLREPTALRTMAATARQHVERAWNLTDSAKRLEDLLCRATLRGSRILEDL